jgi:hypothetical protein
VKNVLLIFIATAALILSIDAQSRSRTASTGDNAWEHGVERVDGYLQKGLSDDTHGTIANQVDDSAAWFQGVGDDLGHLAE